MELLVQLVVAGLAAGSIYALIAIGIVLIYKASRVVNFAQGAYVMLGAYFGYVLLTAARLSPLAAVPLAVLGVGLLGWLTERVVLRPMLRAPVVAVMMATLGLLTMARGAVVLGWGSSNLTFPRIFPDLGLQLAGLYLSPVYLWTILFSFGLVVAFVLVFRYTAWGLAMRATADNPRAALAVGIHVSNVTATVWFVSTALAALGGVLLASLSVLSVGIQAIGLVAFPVIVLGGLESIPGALLAGLVLGLLEVLVGGYLTPWLEAALGMSVGAVEQVLAFAVLILVLLVRPEGLFGQRGVERV